MPEYRYLEVFRTSLIQQPNCIEDDDFTINFFTGSKTYKIMDQRSVVSKKSNSIVMKKTELRLSPEYFYIEIIANTEIENFESGTRDVQNKANRVVTLLSILYTPLLFEEIVYKGWLFDEKSGRSESWIKVGDPVAINSHSTSRKLKGIAKNYLEEEEIRRRFTLMAKFFSKALYYKPGEERFLLLWTILEIYPMQNTSNIKPIQELIAKATGRDSQEIKTKLDLGHIFGIRSKLVHDGIFPVNTEEMGKLFERLERIIMEVFRHMIGISYSGSLNKWLK